MSFLIKIIGHFRKNVILVDVHFGSPFFIPLIRPTRRVTFWPKSWGTLRKGWSKVEPHQRTRWIDGAGGSVPAGLQSVRGAAAVTTHLCMVGWDLLQYWALTPKNHVQKDGWCGSDNNGQNVMGLLFENKAPVVHKLQAFPLTALKFWCLCTVDLTACFS